MKEYLLSQIKAFADTYGYTLYRGVGHHSNEYQLLKQYGNITAPQCKYMTPEEMSIWIEGFLSGKAISAAPNQEAD